LGRPVNMKDKAMQFTPTRTEAEAATLSKPNLLTGWHLGQISEAVEKISQAGNDMMQLTILVAGPNGKPRTIWDYLTPFGRGVLKFRHAAIAVGAAAQYDAGNISPDDFVGRSVQVKLSIQKKTGFPDASRIDDYKVAASSR
jgi:hypothetical protein